MFPRFQRTNGPTRAREPAAGLNAVLPVGGPAAWRGVLRSAGRACCCPARPAVIVVMPPAEGRPRAVDLLLCRHHYRASQKALEAAGAAIFDPQSRAPEAVMPTTSEAARLAAARTRHPSS